MEEQDGSGENNRPRVEVTVREMVLEDLPQVFALGEKLFTADKWPALYRTWDEYELVEFFAMCGDTCLVAEVDDKLAGFAIGSLIEKRRSAWTYGYLNWLGVDPSFKRAGVGSRLVRRLTDLFIDFGARMMIVDTDAENTGALAFFGDQGFADERNHVYLSKNLTGTRRYERRQQEKKVPRRMRAPAVPADHLAARMKADGDQEENG